MRKATVTLMAMFMFAFSSPAFCNWEIPFGQEKAQVGITAPVHDEDMPVGPGSYRAHGSDIWVLDSVKGRVLCFGADNKVRQEVALPALGKDFILTDFALQLGENGEVKAVATIDMRAKEIVVAGLDGKEIKRIKAGNMMQLDEIDVDRNGQVYVGDYAVASIAVFSADGIVLRNIPWQASGFAVDSSNNLHMLNYSEGSGHALVTIGADGKEVARHEIGMAEMQNPRIWAVKDSGECLVSMVPPSGDPSKQKLMLFSADGKPAGSADFANPYYINRYIAAAKDSIWLVKADYLKAPGEPVKFDSLTLAK
ncbi:MAG TPA: hypothetical protein PKN29_11255 [Candidatus Ozemobacteraceae bacterium]|nr:hypothetical protein [Candidatus Ozemobacteraceae bacterium]